MDIKLFGGYGIESSTHSFDLYYIDNGRKSFEGFYSTLESAITGFLSLKIRGCDADSLLGLISYLKHLETACCKALTTSDNQAQLKKIGGLN